MLHEQRGWIFRGPLSAKGEWALERRCTQDALHYFSHLHFFSALCICSSPDFPPHSLRFWVRDIGIASGPDVGSPSSWMDMLWGGTVGLSTYTYSSQTFPPMLYKHKDRDQAIINYFKQYTFLPFGYFVAPHSFYWSEHKFTNWMRWPI